MQMSPSGTCNTPTFATCTPRPQGEVKVYFVLTPTGTRALGDSAFNFQEALLKIRSLPEQVARGLLRTYRLVMQILRQGDKEVMKVETRSGVTGYIATGIPASAIKSLTERLTAQLDATRQNADSNAPLSGVPGKPA